MYNNRKLDQIKIIPIMVGSISERKERMYGELLAKYLVDPQTLFIVSSDFCHWYVLLSAKRRHVY